MYIIINKFTSLFQRRYADDIVDYMINLAKSLKEKNLNGSLDLQKDIGQISLFGGVTRVQQSNDINFDSTINYLNKREIRDKLDNILSSLQINKDVLVHPVEQLGRFYFEITAICETVTKTKKYNLNLWPCSQCACISVELKSSA